MCLVYAFNAGCTFFYCLRYLKNCFKITIKLSIVCMICVEWQEIKFLSTTISLLTLPQLFTWHAWDMTHWDWWTSFNSWNFQHSRVSMIFLRLPHFYFFRMHTKGCVEGSRIANLVTLIHKNETIIVGIFPLTSSSSPWSVTEY